MAPLVTFSAPLSATADGVPYFRAVQGSDRKWHWAKCPVCSMVVLDTDGLGASRHWKLSRHLGWQSLSR